MTPLTSLINFYHRDTLADRLLEDLRGDTSGVAGSIRTTFHGFKEASISWKSREDIYLRSD